MPPHKMFRQSAAGHGFSQKDFHEYTLYKARRCAALYWIAKNLQKVEFFESPVFAGI
jgi:hypothetical protein